MTRHLRFFASVMSLTDMLFAVFYGGDAAVGGARFRVLTEPPDPVDFDEEYGIVDLRSASLSVAFFQHGKAFEFCGAGALCLAELYAESGAEKRVYHSTFPFFIRHSEDGPEVGLPVAKAAGDSTDVQLNFPGQDVCLYLQSSPQAVAKFSPSTAPNADSVNTVIAVHLDSRARRINFRYFTRFNDKGEDPATGSVFRYLGLLPLDQEVWYDVHQASDTGAVMQCRLQSDRLWYTGKVRRIG